MGRSHRPARRPPTEVEVVGLAADGLNPEIAARLFMSRNTVKTHLSHVYAKLGITNRTELATAATARGGRPAQRPRVRRYGPPDSSSTWWNSPGQAVTGRSIAQ